ncbi:hypothetical protein V8C44DRAFT_315331 [Trichoderma aethiopicum]
MALSLALAGFCSAAGTLATEFNAIPCRRVPNRPRGLRGGGERWERRLSQSWTGTNAVDISSGPARTWRQCFSAASS